MKNSIRLSIPNPCSEKWENFTPTSTGGFCGSCYKTVVDFTKMSDQEIIQFLKDKPHTCGRLRSDQIKDYKELPVYNIRPSRMLLRAGMISLFLALIAKPSFSQTVPEPVKKEVAQKGKASKEAFTRQTKHLVTGTVISADDGMKLPGVNVVLAGTNIGTVTDAEGYFEFPQMLSEGDKLEISFIGLKPTSFVVNSDKNESIIIKMEADVVMLGEVIMMGEVSVDAAYTPKRSSNSLFAIIKRWF